MIGTKCKARGLLPSSCSKVRALATALKVRPGPRLVEVRHVGPRVGENVLGIVRVNEVFDNGAGL